MGEKEERRERKKHHILLVVENLVVYLKDFKYSIFAFIQEVE